MSFYSNVFDPKLVIGQIFAMQCLGYLSQSCLVWLLHELFATPLSLEQIFSVKAMGWDTANAAAASAAVVFNGLWIGLELSFVVERAKKCLDFVVTFFFIHFLICWKYDGFPTDWHWWGVNLCALVIASVSGEYLCMKKELQEINVNEFLSMRPAHRVESASPPPIPASSGTSAGTNSTSTVKEGSNNVQRRPSSAQQRPSTPGEMV